MSYHLMSSDDLLRMVRHAIACPVMLHIISHPAAVCYTLAYKS